MKDSLSDLIRRRLEYPLQQRRYRSRYPLQQHRYTLQRLWYRILHHNFIKQLGGRYGYYSMKFQAFHKKLRDGLGSYRSRAEQQTIVCVSVCVCVYEYVGM